MFTILDLLQKIFSSGGMLHSHSAGYLYVAFCRLLVGGNWLMYIDSYIKLYKYQVCPKDTPSGSLVL